MISKINVPIDYGESEINVEVPEEDEAEFALSFEKSLIGINNRNLKTLETSLNTSIKLSKILNDHKSPLISESGFDAVETINFIKKFMTGKKQSIFHPIEAKDAFSKEDYI